MQYGPWNSTHPTRTSNKPLPALPSTSATPYSHAPSLDTSSLLPGSTTNAEFRDYPNSAWPGFPSVKQLSHGNQKPGPDNKVHPSKSKAEDSPDDLPPWRRPDHPCGPRLRKFFGIEVKLEEQLDLQDIAYDYNALQIKHFLGTKPSIEGYDKKMAGVIVCTRLRELILTTSVNSTQVPIDCDLLKSLKFESRVNRQCDGLFLAHRAFGHLFTYFEISNDTFGSSIKYGQAINSHVQVW